MSGFSGGEGAPAPPTPFHQVILRATFPAALGDNDLTSGFLDGPIGVPIGMFSGVVAETIEDPANIGPIVSITIFVAGFLHADGGDPTIDSQDVQYTVGSDTSTVTTDQGVWPVRFGGNTTPGTISTSPITTQPNATPWTAAALTNIVNVRPRFHVVDMGGLDNFNHVNEIWILVQGTL